MSQTRKHSTDVKNVTNRKNSTNEKTQHRQKICHIRENMSHMTKYIT
jgi:hypothetical protein